MGNTSRGILFIHMYLDGISVDDVYIHLFDEGHIFYGLVVIFKIYKNRVSAKLRIKNVIGDFIGCVMRRTLHYYGLDLEVFDERKNQYSDYHYSDKRNNEFGQVVFENQPDL
jgi:hypothetical protein